MLDSLPRLANAAFNAAVNEKWRICIPGTQKKVLDRIQAWTEDPQGKLLFLLEGMAGLGKSSIARTTAQRLHENHAIGSEIALTTRTDWTCLGASFFLERGDETRENLQHFFPVIAVAIAENISALKPYVADAIRNDRGIKDKVISQQFTTLLLEPLQKFDVELAWPIRIVVVIDALDECKYPKQVAALLGSLPQLDNLRHVQLRFLITSRWESDIRFAIPLDVSERMTLDKIAQSKQGSPRQDDITRLLTTDFQRITEQFYNGRNWISAEKTEQLIQKTGGLFIYAATISLFLDGNILRSTRTQRVRDILQGTTSKSSPEWKMDDIYNRVLSFDRAESAHLSPKEKQQEYRLVRSILACVALTFKPVSIPTVTAFLATYDTDEANEAGKIDDDAIRESLSRLHAIISVPEAQNGTLAFYHNSFREYLLTPSRALPEVAVAEKKTHRFLLHACLQIMKAELKQDMCKLRLPGQLVADMPKKRLERYMSPHLRYACLYWVRHLTELHHHQQDLAELQDSGPVHTFFKTKFLFWLEALSLTGEMPESIRMINALRTIAKVSPRATYDL